mmetsp:Transcript_17072/g.30463  ORF Transcript_17072/g.30463 Transcript_17072/m.30463 type:complete len:404 (-) Transcript_17072:1310-2521(-)
MRKERTGRSRQSAVFRITAAFVFLAAILLAISVVHSSSGGGGGGRGSSRPQQTPASSDFETHGSRGDVAEGQSTQATGHSVAGSSQNEGIRLASVPTRTVNSTPTLTYLECKAVKARNGTTDYYYWSPSSPPRGLLIAIHGCSHGGWDWFRLPEEMRIVRLALAAQFAVFAPSSSSAKGSGCWMGSEPSSNKDISRVSGAVEDLIGREPSFRNLPMFAIGASSGGTFVSILAKALPLKLIVIQVAYGQAQALRDLPESLQHVVWAYMPRDSMGPTIMKRLALVQKQGRKGSILEYRPRRLSPEYFAQWMMGIDSTASAKMYNTLGPFTDAEGKLLHDPRGNRTYTLLTLLASVPPELRKRFPKNNLKEALREDWSKDDKECGSDRGRGAQCGLGEARTEQRAL